MRTGVDGITKHIDIFLINDSLLQSGVLIKQWIGEGGNSDHFLIFMEFHTLAKKPPSAFKFNACWLEIEDYKSSIKNIWLSYKPDLHGYAGIHFLQNLNRIKDFSISWDANIKYFLER